MNAETIALVLASLGIGAAIVEAIRAIAQRHKIGADAVAVVSAAARELVEPLRKELAQERLEHSAEIDVERRRVAEVRTELTAALDEAKHLRGELALARVEADELRRDREQYRAQVRRLEHQLAQRNSS